MSNTVSSSKTTNNITSANVSANTSTSSGAADMTRRMICGGLAGMIAKTATNPLERIKMLSQTGEHNAKNQSLVNGSVGSSNGKNVSILELYKTIIRNEGVIGLWAGNGANLLRVFPVSMILIKTLNQYVLL